MNACGDTYCYLSMIHTNEQEHKNENKNQLVRLLAFCASPYVLRASRKSGWERDGASKLNGCFTSVTGDFERLLDIRG